ncbi:hypothetical protein DDE04_00995 [Bifidobacterium pseudocatenulatum]|nr:hypothetical protein [Bifidobacterium pseudocatenulatum]
MSFYFNGKDTREVVSRNFNSIRKLFGLSSQRLAGLMEPLAQIPYQKVRRLAAGERDITAEELNVLYELLAVPPATFTFPWSLQDKQPFKISVLLHEAHLSPNPIFDHLGTPLYPYEISGKENWLPAQLVGEALTNSACLFEIDRKRQVGKTEYMRDTLAAKLQTKIQEYTKSIFPTEQYEKAFKTLYSHYQANADGSLTLNNISQFLECLGHALLEYMRKEATLSFYSQLEKNTQDSLFSHCYYDQSFSRAYNHWIHDDPETLFQLVNYVGHSNLDITMRIDASISTMDSTPSRITLIAKERNADHIIGSATTSFNYEKWFTCTKPTKIKMSGIIGKNASLDTNTVTVWEGDLWEELYGERPDYGEKLSLRRFPYLYPVFIK